MTTIATPPVTPNPTPTPVSTYPVNLVTALASRDVRISYGDENIAYEDDFRNTTVSAGGKIIFQNHYSGLFVAPDLRISNEEHRDAFRDIEKYARFLGQAKSKEILLALQANTPFDGPKTPITRVISTGSTIAMCGSPVDIKLGIDYKTLMKMTGDSAKRLGLADFRVGLKSGGETVTIVDPTNTFVIVAHHKSFSGSARSDFVKVLYVDPRITDGRTLRHESLKEGACLRGSLAAPLAYALVNRVSNALSGW